MGPVRAFVPLIAGITAMKNGRFQMANLGSALVWVPIMLAPGYLAGKGVSGLAGVDGHTVGYVAAACVLATVAAALTWRMVKRRLSPGSASPDHRPEQGGRGQPAR